MRQLTPAGERKVKRFGATLFALVLLAPPAVGTSSAAAQENENASCVAHFVHGPAGPPGQFRSRFGPEFPFGAFGQQVSEIARTEGETFAECRANRLR